MSKKKTNVRCKSVKEMLLERRERQNASTVHIENCVFMRTKSDIVTGSYHPNSFARKWFRENTNINEVLDHYIAIHNISAEFRDKHTNMAIKKVISDAEKKYKYPYNLFKFNTLRDESVGKLILMHPQIYSYEDLNMVERYYAENDLKHCSVLMNSNNYLHNNIQKFLENKKEKQHVDEKLVHCCRQEALDITMRRYYWENNLTEIIPLEELTLEKMYEISNYRAFIEHVIEIYDINPNEYDDVAQQFFDRFKIDPDPILDDKMFFLAVSCAIVTNNLTEREERSICNNILKFYDITNATDIFRKLWHTLQPGRIKEEKIEFHRRYKGMPNKKLPPFHTLRMKRQNIEQPNNEGAGRSNSEQHQQSENSNQVEIPEIIAEPDNIIEPAIPENIRAPSVESDNLRPSVSGTSPEKLSFQQKDLVEKSYQQTSEAPNTNIEVDQDIIMVEAPTEGKLPSHYGLDPEVSSDVQNLFNMVKKEYKLDFAIIGYLEDKYPHNFADSFRDMNQKNAIKNCIVDMLKDDPRRLQEMVNSCVVRQKTEVAQIVNSLIIDTAVSSQYTENFEPLLSSTQSIADEALSIQKSSSLAKEPRAAENERNPFQNDANERNSDSLSVVEVSTSDHRTIIAAASKDALEKTIKQEKISQNYIQSVSPPNSSDVQIISRCETIIVLDSDDKENPNNEILEANERDDCLAMFEKDSQNDPEVLEKLKQFELKAHHPAIEDKKEEAAQNAQPKGTCSTMKNKCTLPNNLNFIDTQSQENSKSQLELPKHFSFISTIRNKIIKTPGISETSCFIVELQRICYQKEFKFEAFVNFPQFICYDILVNRDDIKEVFKISDLKWQTLLKNLETVGKYEFVIGSYRFLTEKCFQSSIIKQLDLFFSTLSRASSFQLYSDGNSFTCLDVTTTSQASNVTSAIKGNILKNLKTMREKLP